MSRFVPKLEQCRSCLYCDLITPIKWINPLFNHIIHASGSKVTLDEQCCQTADVQPVCINLKRTDGKLLKKSKSFNCSSVGSQHISPVEIYKHHRPVWCGCICPYAENSRESHFFYRRCRTWKSELWSPSLILASR